MNKKKKEDYQKDYQKEYRKNYKITDEQKQKYREAKKT